MNRGFRALIGGATLALTVVVPIDPAGADEVVANDEGGSQPVVESETGSYIVVMKADPLVATIAPDDLDSAAAQAQGEALDRHPRRSAHRRRRQHRRKVQDYTNARQRLLRRHRATTRPSRSPRTRRCRSCCPTSCASSPRTDSVTHDNGGSSQDDLGNFLGLTGRGPAWASGLTGEGVIVGVIDTGIWPEHPSFADNGSYPAHDPLDDSRPNCEFGNTAMNPPTPPFTCNNKLIGARQMLDTYRSLTGGFEPDEFDSARDDDGHGTHTASTAAGNANVQAVVVRPQHRQGLGHRPSRPDHRLQGPRQRRRLQLRPRRSHRPGRRRRRRRHQLLRRWRRQPAQHRRDRLPVRSRRRCVRRRLRRQRRPRPGDHRWPVRCPWVTSVGANTQRRLFQGTIHLDNGRSYKGASITRGTRNRALVDAATAGTSDLCLADTLDPAKVQGKIVLCRRGGNGRVAKSQEVLRAGGAGMILYNATDTDNLFTDNFFVPTVHIDNSVGLKIKQYIASTRRPRAQLDDTAEISHINYAPSMTIFSSRGPEPHLGRHHQARHHRPRPADPRRRLARRRRRRGAGSSCSRPLPAPRCPAR